MRIRQYFLSAVLLVAAPVLSRETVVEDVPARLTLSVEATGYHVEAGPFGPRVLATGFQSAEKTGSPDLPWYAFQIASGAQTPSVSVIPEEWVELPFSGELGGVPRALTTLKYEAFRDPALFAASENIRVQVSEIRRYRGMSIRSINLPIASYVPGSSRVRLMKRFRIQVSFSDARPTPDTRVQEWLIQAGIKNVQGGPYLTTLLRPKPLPKTARTQVTFQDSYIKIRIGDRQVDGTLEDGVYSLTYEQAVAANPDIAAGIRVPNLHLYAGPKDTLRASIDTSASGLVAPTLTEIPIQVLDPNGLPATGANEPFSTGYRILFYAHGTSIWKPIPGAASPVRWKFGSDPYSFDNYYYLDWKPQPTSARLATPAAHPTVTETFTNAPHYVRAERDANTGSCDPAAHRVDDETGYDWYWYFRGTTCETDDALTLSASQLSSSTTDSLEGYVPGDTTWLGFFGYRELTDSSAFKVKVSGANLPSRVLPSVSGTWYYQSAALANKRIGLESVIWSGVESRFEGYTVRYPRTLAWSGKSKTIFPAATGRWVAYNIGSSTGVSCLRVEGGVGTRWIPIQGNIFTDSAGNGEDVQYFLYSAPLPLASPALAAEEIHTEEGVVKDLRNGDNLHPKYLIIAPEALLSGALALRKYRIAPERQMSLPTAVVRLEDIYRDWSGGRMSPMAIRDLLRYALHQWGGQLHYVLLYGDGHYDYRDIRNSSARNPAVNRIPPYNWDNPEQISNPMSTDDFYAVLEGDWRVSSTPLTVALGRLPVQTVEQGQNYLEKVRRYEDPRTAGDWRNKVTLTADDQTQHGAPGDADPVSSPTHVSSSEALADKITEQEPGIRVDKIYLLDYPFNAQFVKPEAQQDLLKNLNQGSLYYTFFGHGAYNQLADEVLMKTNETLSGLRNVDKAFMIGIFSCTVGRYEKLQDDGMLEQFVRQKDYGAITGLGASRESYPTENTNLAMGVAARLFLPQPSSVILGVGDAVQSAKNALIGEGNFNKQKYILTGEPVVVIRGPGPAIQITERPDSLQGLQCGVLRGRIPGGSGRGNVSVRIVAGGITKVYPYPVWTLSGLTTEYTQAQKRGQILFERTVGYRDSAFTMAYFLPKQLPIGDTSARIQFFAWDSLKPLESGTAITSLRISGNTAAPSSCSVTDDGKGPRITVTGCNSKESGEVNFPDQIKISLPYCFQVDVTDTAGGVLSGDGPDEGTTLEVVGAVDPFHPQAGVDDLYHKSYQLTLQNSQLSKGTHLLKVSAHDGFGNLSQRQVTVEVSNDSALRFVRTFNAPNPMKRNGTTFYFSTTLPQDPGEALVAPNVDRIRFDLRIFNQLGRLVREFPEAQSGQFWDGTDAWGQKLANGVYFYQVTAVWDVANGAPGQGQQTSQRNTLVLSR